MGLGSIIRTLLTSEFVFYLKVYDGLSRYICCTTFAMAYLTPTVGSMSGDRGNKKVSALVLSVFKSVGMI